MSKILLTVSSGFLGSNLLQLVMTSNEIVILERQKGDYIFDISKSKLKGPSSN